MKKLIAVALLTLMAGCGGADTTAPQVTTGTVFFKIDAVTCSSMALPVTFFVDGSAVGTETIAGGGTSKGYTTSAGQHVVGAKVSNSTYTWPNSTITVPANGTLTHFLPC